MLRECQTPSSSIAGSFSSSKLKPLSLAANASAQFWSIAFATFSPDCFLFGASFELSNEHGLCVSSTT